MGSLFLPTPVEERAPPARTGAAGSTKEETVLIAGFGDGVASDYASYLAADFTSPNRGGASKAGIRPQIVIVSDLPDPAVLARTLARGIVPDLILFLKPRLADQDRERIDALLALAARENAPLVTVVSSFRIHLGDQAAADAEVYVAGRVRSCGMRMVVFRAGRILSRHSRAATCLRMLSCFYPLVPRRLHSCWLDGDELFAAIVKEGRTRHRQRYRTFTLLGSNCPWHEVLKQNRPRALWVPCLTVLSALLALLQLGRLVGLVLDLLARHSPPFRSWNFDTLRPRSMRELLALYNKYNYRHVKMVGYNNGVVHFGHRYPGKTVVSTVHCDRVIRAGPGAIKADCGATIQKARQFLARTGQDLHVVPNYSYVCLGTSFFVPIHGSAAVYTTVAETIAKVVLYDPELDRLIVARREQPAFAEHLYNLASPVLLLRLTIRVKDKERYCLQRQELENPQAGELLAALRDRQAANVEIRAANASNGRVVIRKYYRDPTGVQAGRLELPRDALGSLWDRLEENWFTSFLLHALTRHFAWHVELFLSAQEFTVFWKVHAGLPLRKIQVRFIQRDGFPHSPFRLHDCVSVDMFMLRRHRRRFESFWKSALPLARANPGKHSR